MKYLILFSVVLLGCQTQPKVEAQQTKESEIENRIFNVESKVESYRMSTDEKLNALQISIEELRKEIKQKKKLTKAKQQKAKPFTGAVVFLLRGHPQSIRLMNDLNNTKYLGWKIGSDANNHFVVSPNPPEKGLSLQIVYYKNGDVVSSMDGYTGNINDVLNHHPKANLKKQTRRYARQRKRTYGYQNQSYPILNGNIGVGGFNLGSSIQYNQKTPVIIDDCPT